MVHPGVRNSPRYVSSVPPRGNEAQDFRWSCFEIQSAPDKVANCYRCLEGKKIDPIGRGHALRACASQYCGLCTLPHHSSGANVQRADDLIVLSKKFDPLMEGIELGSYSHNNDFLCTNSRRIYCG